MPPGTGTAESDVARGSPGWVRSVMAHPRGTQGARNGRRPPGPDATTAAAFAPPPAERRSIELFVAALLLAVCGVTGVLSFFTAYPVGYRVLLLLVALLSAVALWRLLRRRPDGPRSTGSGRVRRSG